MNGEERIAGHLEDIETALLGIGLELEKLTAIAHLAAACFLGFDPLRGTDYDESGDIEPPPWLNG